MLLKFQRKWPRRSYLNRGYLPHFPTVVCRGPVGCHSVFSAFLALCRFRPSQQNKGTQKLFHICINWILAQWFQTAKAWVTRLLTNACHSLLNSLKWCRVLLSDVHCACVPMAHRQTQVLRARETVCDDESDTLGAVKRENLFRLSMANKVIGRTQWETEGRNEKVCHLYDIKMKDCKESAIGLPSSQLSGLTPRKLRSGGKVCVTFA